MYTKVVDINSFVLKPTVENNNTQKINDKIIQQLKYRKLNVQTANLQNKPIIQEAYVVNYDLATLSRSDLNT